MIDGNPLMGLIGNLVKRNEDLEKRVARLETLEFTDIHTACWVEIETKSISAWTLSTTFSSIPQTYLHLALVYSLRADDSTGRSSLLLQFNADTGANYWYVYMQGVDPVPGACVVSCGSATTTSIYAGGIPGNSFGGDPAYDDIFSAGDCWIPDYRNQYKKKSVVWNNYYVCADLEEVDEYWAIEKGGGTWHDLSPITSITCIGGFTKNSKISLYGICGTFLEYA